jgi:hypothetical protein
MRKSKLLNLTSSFNLDDSNRNMSNGANEYSSALVGCIDYISLAGHHELIKLNIFIGWNGLVDIIYHKPSCV